MRVNAQDGSMSAAARRLTTVYLDGVKVDCCVAADDAEGWVDAYELASADPVRRHGAVRINTPAVDPGLVAEPG